MNKKYQEELLKILKTLKDDASELDLKVNIIDKKEYLKLVNKIKTAAELGIGLLKE